MLKQELIGKIKSKVSKADPTPRRLLVSGLEYKNKKQLQSILRRVKVTRNGDISLA